MKGVGTKIARAGSPIQVLPDEIQNYIIYKEVWIPTETSAGNRMDYEMDITEIGGNFFKSSPMNAPFLSTGVDIKVSGLIIDLERLIESIVENFGDIRDRQIFFFEFKEKLNELWKMSTGDTKKAVLRLESAIKNLKSEELTEEQVYALENAIGILKHGGRGAKQELQNVLLDAGIFTIPVIEGLTEMYVDAHD